MVNESAESALRLSDHLQVLRRQWLAVLVCLLIGVGAALAYLYWAPKQFEATTSVLVTPTGDSSSSVADKNNAINMDTGASARDLHRNGLLRCGPTEQH